MLKKNKIICIIPAKLNSQRIKKKNIINLNGFSLLEYTLKAVKNSKFIDKEKIKINRSFRFILQRKSQSGYTFTC